jgi:hypothetical protein
MQGTTPAAVNPALASLEQVNFQLVVPERGVNGSSVDEWHLGYLVTVSMRQVSVRLLSDEGAAAIERMSGAASQLQPTRAVVSVPILEVRVTTKRQGDVVGFAVWLRLYGNGFDPVTYNEQGVAPLPEEGLSVNGSVGRLLKKFLADIDKARKNNASTIQLSARPPAARR